MSVRRIITAKRVPLKIKRAFLSLEEAKCGEERMWRDMLARAILDALDLTGISDLGDRRDAVRDAVDWFKRVPFRQVVFDNAGVNIEAVEPVVLLHVEESERLMRFPYAEIDA